MNTYFQYTRSEPYCQFELGCLNDLCYIDVSLHKRLARSYPTIFFNISKNIMGPTLKRYLDKNYQLWDKLSKFIIENDGLTFTYNDHSSLKIFYNKGLFI